MKIDYVTGDVTNPIGNENKLICHCCNDSSKMGSGVAKALFMKWNQVRSNYLDYFKKNENNKLGDIQCIKIQKDIVVVNMIGQHNIISENGVPPIRYDAMEKCLEKVCALAIKFNASVHIPYLMGADRAGGDWNKIEQIIEKQLCDNSVKVIVYDIDNRRNQGSGVTSTPSTTNITNPIDSISPDDGGFFCIP